MRFIERKQLLNLKVVKHTSKVTGVVSTVGCNDKVFLNKVLFYTPRCWLPVKDFIVF